MKPILFFLFTSLLFLFLAGYLIGDLEDRQTFAEKAGSIFESNKGLDFLTQQIVKENPTFDEKVIRDALGEEYSKTLLRTALEDGHRQWQTGDWSGSATLSFAQISDALAREIGLPKSPPVQRDTISFSYEQRAVDLVLLLWKILPFVLIFFAASVAFSFWKQGWQATLRLLGQALIFAPLLLLVLLSFSLLLLSSFVGFAFLSQAASLSWPLVALGIFFFVLASKKEARRQASF